MTESVRRALARIVVDHGRIVGDWMHARNVLKDVFPQLPREVNLLVQAVQAGVTSEISAIEGAIDQLAVRRLAERLRDQFGTAAELATWTVGEWAAALGKNGLGAEPAHLCPVSVGFWSLHHIYAADVDQSAPFRDTRFLLVRGSVFDGCLGPVWFPGPVVLGDHQTPLELIVDDGNGPVRHQSCYQLANLLESGGLWYVGLSVDDSNEFYFHYRREGCASVLRVPLGRLEPGHSVSEG